jgi:hypothetical protein
MTAQSRRRASTPALSIAAAPRSTRTGPCAGRRPSRHSLHTKSVTNGRKQTNNEKLYAFMALERSAAARNQRDVIKKKGKEKPKPKKKKRFFKYKIAFSHHAPVPTPAPVASFDLANIPSELAYDIDIKRENIGRQLACKDPRKKKKKNRFGARVFFFFFFFSPLILSPTRTFACPKFLFRAMYALMPKFHLQIREMYGGTGGHWTASRHCSCYISLA